MQYRLILLSEHRLIANCLFRYRATPQSPTGVNPAELMVKRRLRTVTTIVIAHTFCASPDTRISYCQCLLIQEYFCAV